MYLPLGVRDTHGSAFPCVTFEVGHRHPSRFCFALNYTSLQILAVTCWVDSSLEAFSHQLCKTFRSITSSHGRHFTAYYSPSCHGCADIWSSCGPIDPANSPKTTYCLCHNFGKAQQYLLLATQCKTKCLALCGARPAIVKMLTNCR